MAPLQKEGGVAYLGTMGWSYPFWVNKLYPESAKQNDYLVEYAKHFNSVEIDATFYRVPSISIVKNWASKVPEKFRFAAKFPQSVTHSPNLTFDIEKLEVFLKHIRQIGNKLGPLLLQFPPFLKLNVRGLGNLLDTLPSGNMYAVEFRNRSWYTEEVYSLLSNRNVSLVRTNRAGTASKITADFTYFRWEGDRKLVNGEKGLVERDRSKDTRILVLEVQKILDSGGNVYCYFSKYYSGYPPNDVEELRSALTS